MNFESNKSVFNKYAMSFRDEGMEGGVIESMKCSILRWFGHIERMLETVYVSKIALVGTRGHE